MIPSLARDMIDPTQFDSMINWAFVSFFLNTLGPKHPTDAKPCRVSRQSFTWRSGAQATSCLEMVFMTRYELYGVYTLVLLPDARDRSA